MDILHTGDLPYDPETLRLLDLFLPRISLHSPTATPKPSGLSTAQTEGQHSQDNASKDDRKGFSYLKRDLVRLLGILSYRSTLVQDQVRVCGGIPVVLNLCVMDERNPCE